MKKKKLIYVVFTIMLIIFVVLFASAMPGFAYGGVRCLGWDLAGVRGGGGVLRPIRIHTMAIMRSNPS